MPRIARNPNSPPSTWRISSKSTRKDAKTGLATSSFYVVATPLGNLGDVSVRLKKTLERCDPICAEDTRVARRLLSALGITGKKLISVRMQNEAQMASKLASLAKAQSIAYLSDAGTPGISDPGAALVAAMHKNGVPVVPIAGPSAVTAALSVSGLASDSFIFAGFLPRSKERASKRLNQLGMSGMPLVIFESPQRISETLQLLALVFGHTCRICLCAELTKLHESVSLTTIERAIAKLEEMKKPRGEYTLVLEPPERGQTIPLDAAQIATALAKELPPSRAAKLAAKLAGADPRALYQMLAAGKEPKDGAKQQS